MNIVFNEDCVPGMINRIEDNSIDLILADPPYQISKPSQLGTLKDRKNARTGTYFGEWDDNFDNNKWIEQASRVLKNGGSLLTFNDVKKVSLIIDIATKNGLVYKDSLIWKKTNPMPRNRDRRYVQDIEILIWFVKPSKPWTFNRVNEPYESCVKVYPVESGGGYKRIHPTQKPLKLILDLVNIHSNEGDVVLDPFMGSGTTAIACISSNRKYIGFELNEQNILKLKESLKEYLNFDELTPELINSLIDHITLSHIKVINGVKTRNIKIAYKYVS